MAFLQLSGALALMLLAALLAADSVAADSSPGDARLTVAEAVCRTGLPDNMLQDIAACTPALTQQVGHSGQSRLAVPACKSL